MVQLAVDCCLSPKRKTARCPAAAAAAAAVRCCCYSCMAGMDREWGGKTGRHIDGDREFRLAQFFFLFSDSSSSSPCAPLRRRDGAPSLLPPLSRRAAGAIDRSGEDRRLCRRVFLTHSADAFFFYCSQRFICVLAPAAAQTPFFSFRYDCCYVNWGI